MNKRLIKYLAFAFFAGILSGCGKLDYQNTEFFKKEVYIISSESTSAVARDIVDVPAYTFVDTLKVINANYDTKFIRNEVPAKTQVKFKIGYGGSLVSDEDIVVKVIFDTPRLADFNVEKSLKCYIPDALNYTTNIPFDKAANAFMVTIPKGSASTSLVFDVKIERAKMDDYKNYAFPLKIESAEGLPLSRLNTRFLIANLRVQSSQTINLSGFPTPEIPSGRYLSQRCKGNAAEDRGDDGLPRPHKFVTKLGDTPELKGKYVIWGTCQWSFETFGFHGMGWMYDKLYMSDPVAGTYTRESIKAGDPDYPVSTFSLSTGAIDKCTYDPFTKTLVVFYTSIGQPMTDLLTYVSDDFTLSYAGSAGSGSPHNWEEVRAKGYKYWLPIK